MLRILDRYLLREVLLTLAATVVVLLLMVLSVRLARYLGQAASGGLAQGSILQLLGLQALRLLVDLIPAATLLAALLALGRLYRDNEMVALAACGLGPGAVYRPLLLLGVPLALLLAALSLALVPTASRLQYEVRDRAQQEAELWLVQPGSFRAIDDGKHVVYVGSMSTDQRELRDIFIYSRGEPRAASDTPAATDQQAAKPARFDDTAATITRAALGRQRIDAQSGARYLVLESGRRYQGWPGRADYQIASFQTLNFRIASAPPEQRRLRRKALPTQSLLGSDEPRLHAELQRRLSPPLTLLLLTLLAPLLAQTGPRDGRYARVVTAILIYAIYANLLSVSEAWLERDKIPAWLGLWWVHGLLGLGIITLYLRHYGLPRPALSATNRQRPATALDQSDR